MKYLSTKFEDYINEINTYNLHENKQEIFKNAQYNNLIIYGPAGVGKYSQMLNIVKNQSPTNLKYERKINYNFQNKKEILIKISDIHFEIDMELLGCNAKILFNDLYYHIIDIISLKSERKGIIVCKNFHKIHSELLDIFFSYMQNLMHKKIEMKFILLTEQVSFIPDNILERCEIISLDRPTKIKYSKCVGNLSKIELSEITNIKNLKMNITKFNDKHCKLSDKIIDKIENYKEINYLEFRDMLYDLFIYEIDVLNSIYYIIEYFINTGKINQNNIDKIFYKLDKFLVFFNNNYRPIYHLESFLLYLCISIHGIHK